MAKICVDGNSKKQNCKNCGHDMYDVEYEQHCCYAQPDAAGYVYWTPKKGKDDSKEE
jgi:hypothetical protein